MPLNLRVFLDQSLGFVLLQVSQQDAGANLEKIVAQQDSLVTRTVLLALVPVVVAFSFIVFVFYRARREAYFKHKETELKLSIVEGELKALRAQINPHFIFNCLNSIHHYMHQQDLAKAGAYLVKFSQLIRHVLESSAHRLVPLSEEMEANRIYLQLEALRMGPALDFDLICSPDLDPDKICVPPMLVQPFVENAVWHGVAGGGKVEVVFTPGDDRHILCTVRDTGREQAPKSEIDLSTNVRKTSMGVSLMQERFDTLNQRYGTQSGFTISDRSDAIGKQVVIRLPFED